MAQKPLSNAAAERMNLVAQDEIWKCRLRAETEARQNWPAKWGYLTTSMKEVIGGSSGASFPSRLQKLLEGEEESQMPKPKIELPSHFRVRPVSPMDKYIKVRKTSFYTAF
ncbi:ciliary microtubule inner protein 1 isoform X3 [Arvicanthis niloticus]|uniref:ciliary microtubule inner protein 1 isoform X3 n=1 Tax=Arvicanthis niloticus TaxID=61156 RepID=UPI00402B7585